MKINVLGTEYEIRRETDDDKVKMASANGYCETYSKEIVIAEFEETGQTINCIEDFEKKVKRHEIIHAFLQESGLACNSDWATNEEMVDWFALQFWKLAEAFEKAGCK